VAKEFLIAELLLKGIVALSGGLAAVAKGIPEDSGDKREVIKAWSTKLEKGYNDGLKWLNANDYSRAVGEVTWVLNEFSGSSDTFRSIVKMLEELKLEELANYVEFLSPKATQKE